MKRGDTVELRFADGSRNEGELDRFDPSGLLLVTDTNFVQWFPWQTVKAVTVIYSGGRSD